jgi:hypothetical protein
VYFVDITVLIQNHREPGHESRTVKTARAADFAEPFTRR